LYENEGTAILRSAFLAGDRQIHFIHFDNMTSSFFIDGMTAEIREHIFYMTGRVPDWPHVFRLAMPQLWDRLDELNMLSRSLNTRPITGEMVSTLESNLLNDSLTEASKVVRIMELVRGFLRVTGLKLDTPCLGVPAQLATELEREAAKRVFGLRLVCKRFKAEIDGSAFLHRYFANCFFVQISKVFTDMNHTMSKSSFFIPQPNMYGAHTATCIMTWSGPAFASHRAMWERMVSFGCIPPEAGIRLAMEGVPDNLTPHGNFPNFMRYRLAYDRVQGPLTGKLSIITETILMPDDMLADKKVKKPARKRSKQQPAAPRDAVPVDQELMQKRMSEADALLQRAFRECHFEQVINTSASDVVPYQKMLTSVEQDLQTTNKRR
jgi:hypothetical protein